MSGLEGQLWERVVMWNGSRGVAPERTPKPTLRGWPRRIVRTLDVHRYPRTHWPSTGRSTHDEWGIYMMVEHFLDHCQTLYRSFSGKLAAFNLETLMGCLLFEAFHHEFLPG
jgi:hypothetical protein